MASLPGGGDPWRVTAEERAKHDNQFFQLKPIGGFITGEQARNFFIQSGLPVAVLGHIWSLADLNGDGKMDKKEFSIAMHLIKKKLERYELPKTMPASLKADPAPMVGSFGTLPMSAPAPAIAMGMGMMSSPGGFGTMPAGGFGTMPAVPMTMTTGPMPLSNGGPKLLPTAGPTTAAPGFGAAPVAPSVDLSGSDWAIPQPSKLKYTQMFNIQDRLKKGFLSGMEARAILTQSGLTHNFLAQIWSLSDVDNDGKLTCEEFVLAMHLVDVVKSGKPLPLKLPPELIPPSYKRGRSGSGVGMPPGGIAAPQGPPLSPGMPAQSKQPDMFSDLLPMSGFVPEASSMPPEAIEQVKQPDVLMPVTFEDKRKANFEKGQAELEKRQAMLREQQRQEEDARLAAERAEHEKREKLRLEQERRKQEQMERHMEQQRQIEQERDEVRRKAMEQREFARREVERQRQLEWERQRRDQLMDEKQREQKHVDEIGGEAGKLKLELEALESKKSQLHTQIEQARTGVTDLTSTIDRMRQSRDLKLVDIETFQKSYQDWSSKLFRLQQERQQLEITVQAQNNAVDDTLKAVRNSHHTKTQAKERLKTLLQDQEIDTATKLADIDVQNTQLIDNQKLQSEEQTANERLHAQLLEKKLEWENMNNTKKGGGGLAAFKKDSVKIEQNGEVKDSGWSDDTKDVWSSTFSQNMSDEVSNHNHNHLHVGSPHFLDRSTSSEKELTDLWEGLSLSVEQDASSKPAASVDNKGATSATPIDWDMFNQTDLFSGTPSAPSQNNIAWSSFSTNKVKDSAPGPGFKKFQAMFQFEARNFDELSLLPGDVVWIGADQTGAEDGWKKGTCNGKEGFFPEAYVEESAEMGGPPPYTQPDSAGSNTPSQVEQAQTSPTETATSLRESSETPVSASSDVDSQPPGVVHASEQSSFAVVPGHTQSPTPGQGESAPDGLQAQALYPWKAKKDNHLTFNKGDTILVKEQQDMWWSGELAGKIGWFPKSYVKLIGASTNVAKLEVPSEPPQVELTEPTPPVDGDGDCNFPTQESDVESYVALFPYSGTEAGDLHFEQGEVIKVIKKDGDWWTGVIGEQTGVFPANYVKEVDGQATKSTSTSSVESHQLGVQNGSTELGSQTSSLPRQGGKNAKKPEIASVIAAYQATGPEQLSLQPGQLIQVRKKSASGWWEGELQARGQKRKIGWFPANYVKMLGGSARNTPDAQGLSASPQKSPTPLGSEGGSRSTTPVSHPQPTSAPALEQVVAIYNYVGQHADELSFNKGSVINVVSKSDPDWWKGELNDITGMFPANYVHPLSEVTPTDSTPSADMETKRQNHIGELIATEEAYMADMGIVREAFQKPLATEKVLTDAELQAIFVNWKDVAMCNTKLVKALRVRRKMCKGQPIQMIGDILCENLPHMTPYIRFCSCQLNAAALIQSKTENDPKFKEVCKRCCQNPKTKGMPLSSFLLKPMQRITKYPLMLEKLVQYTPEDHPDYQNLQEALVKAVEICSQVNEGVRERDNSDKLEWIQTHVQCEGLAEKLTFNSVTNCLGPRKFIYSGSLYKAKSGKELVGFLFNDFLLLTQPQSTLGSAASVFSFDIKAVTMFKMYRNPIFLNEVMLKKNTGGDSDEENTLFHLSHIDRMYSLRAVSVSERDTWVKKIEAASMEYLDTERKKVERAHAARKMTDKGCGRLMVIVVEGCNLVASDANAVVGRGNPKGKSDPYCEVNMGVQEHKTKVIPNTLNPKWNASMQFIIRDLNQDVVCLTVYDRDLFTPNDFLGRTEIKIADILRETKETKGPISKRLVLHEVESGEVLVKLDIQLFEIT